MFKFGICDAYIHDAYIQACINLFCTRQSVSDSLRYISLLDKEGALSSWFYLLYIDDMLKDLQHSHNALKMRDSSVVLIAQPDYVVHVTPIGFHVLIESKRHLKKFIPSLN